VGKRTGMGIVVDVVPAQKFGFISYVNDDATKRDLLYFNFKSVSRSSLNETIDPLFTSEKRSTLPVKGDEVTFDIKWSGKLSATNVVILPPGTLDIPSKVDKNVCLGYILMEPSYTSLLPSTQTEQVSSTTNIGDGGRWNSCVNEKKGKARDDSSRAIGEGRILLVSDPVGLFSTTRMKTTEGVSIDLQQQHKEGGCDDLKDSEVFSSDSVADVQKPSAAGTPSDSLNSDVGKFVHLLYNSASIAVRGKGSTPLMNNSGPKRGDLVSFIKSKVGKVRDIRIVKKSAAVTVRGVLVELNSTERCACFITAPNSGNPDNRSKSSSVCQ